MNAAFSQHIDLARQEFLEVLTKADKIQQRPIGIHVNQEIEIARRTRIAARYRSKHSDIARTVFGSDFENGASSALNVHGRLIIA